MTFNSEYFQNKVEQIREDFPILKTFVRNKPLIYFDNAATTQKPKVVIDRVSDFYNFSNSNVHRGVHLLSTIATEDFENARKTIAKFINAKNSYEVIFTRGTTESVNLVANSFCNAFLEKGDEIIVSELDHHSNFVPWQQACLRKKATLRFIPIKPNGELDLEVFEKMLSKKTKLVAISHISNTLGVINDIEKIISLAHNNDTPVFIDGAQGFPHGNIDVQKLDCDFYAFSGHKVYAPMGIGGLYGKEKWLEAMPPYQFGGEMIETVDFEKSTFNELPYKFEAGTPNVADALGFETALKYLDNIGWEWINNYENFLKSYMQQRLQAIDGVKIFGNSENKIATFSFLVDNIHFSDIGTILDQFGIAVRTGNHCTQPLMSKLNITGTIRASLCFYNTKDEIDNFIHALEKAITILS